MFRGTRRQMPALAVGAIALFVALGGSVYAAATKIDGASIKIGSLPGNRVKVGSLPGNRVKPASLTGNRLVPGSITGSQIDAATLGQVPSAVHADNADSARDAETALNAVNATDADKINGHSAGCLQGTREFAGACWQTTGSEAAVSATAAALSCATQGGELPDPLALAAFSQQSGIALDQGTEWSGDVTNLSGKNLFAVVTVAPSGAVDQALSTESKRYRCVIPLVS